MPDTFLDESSVKKVTVTSDNGAIVLTSDDIQVLENAVEILLFSDVVEGEQAREMRLTGKSLHEIMERLSNLLGE
jgi:signal-transduction protein with cAMP-binding, CBS, and nucleotidyltransferase domain